MGVDDGTRNRGYVGIVDGTRNRGYVGIVDGTRSCRYLGVDEEGSGGGWQYQHGVL